ncbi:MAG: VanW family protein [Porphyromonas sp.]|nr:VanW family protein [Porphyromonas sp.]
MTRKQFSPLGSHTVEKPIQRGWIRRKAGKEYFILKRKLRWLFYSRRYAKVCSEMSLKYSLIEHRSMLLRPLKDVEMYLQHNKVTNLKLAIAKINNVVIKPEETFSVWKMIGRPTASKGYLEGLTLCNGKISTDIGGGLCQLGNLIYWMALHTPLTVTERWRHGFDVFPDVNRTIPFACGATLSYNYVDLALKNDTEDTFQINLWLDDTHLNGSICCDKELPLKFEIFESDHKIEQQWWGGYTRHNKIWKRITDSQTGEQETLLVAENNAIMMYQPILPSKGEN